MTYSFDDYSFGVSDSRRTKIDTVIVERPPQLSNSDWYKFAGKIADYFNGNVQLHLENQTVGFDWIIPEDDDTIEIDESLYLNGQKKEFNSNNCDNT